MFWTSIVTNSWLISWWTKWFNGKIVAKLCRYFINKPKLVTGWQRSQTMRLLTAFASRFYEIKERDLTLCACQLRANNSDAPRLKLRTNSCHSRLLKKYDREMAYNTTTWTERSNPSRHARFGLVGAAAMHDLHVIQGPNVTRDLMRVREYHSLHSMHSWWKTQDFSKIESGPNYTTAAHAFVKVTLRLGLRAPFVPRKYIWRIWREWYSLFKNNSFDI